jgi:hypothetical protein
VAYAVVAAVTVSLTVAHDQAKPLSSPNGLGRPWSLSLDDSLATNSNPEYAAEITGLDKAVPSGCLGAIVRESDPVYLLYGSHFQRHVVYLSQSDPEPQAFGTGLTAVVVNSQLPVAGQLAAAGWKERPIGGYWLLATRTVRPGTACRP